MKPDREAVFIEFSVPVAGYHSWPGLGATASPTARPAGLDRAADGDLAELGQPFPLLQGECSGDGVTTHPFGMKIFVGK